ncbi:NADH dehydrogenase [Sorangium cellulosum]|uniref:NADH-quinone oxidoreductase subunit H n=1 Tax=Sorangium cellulosum TaxID=56 RepID=A0A150PAV5_SORCE|nr:NADH dehydrogenase [Sorangium cellulosum]
MRRSPPWRALPRGFLPCLLALLALLGAAGCDRSRTAPELLNVIDVVPREVDLGDRIEILGTNLPTAEAREAVVTFRGTLRRPGQAPLTGQSIEIDGAQISSNKVSLVFSEGLEARFAGRGDDAVHTTFHGDVVVEIPATTRGALPVAGTVRGVTIDFIPPTPRRAVIEAREKEGARALAFLGVEVAAESPPSGGLVVTGVRDGSPASRAQIAPGDVITSFEGVKVLSRGDVIPSGHERLSTVGIRRGDAAPSEVRVSTEGFHASAPTDLLGAGIILGVAAAIILLFMAPTAGIITWVERRVSARMQSRIGPNRAGPQGFLVWIADGIKSILKEDVIPAESDRALFRLAPYLVFVGVSATFVVMPFGQYLIAADLDIGILFVIAVTSLVTIGLMTGGWASNNKWSLLGGIRSAAQIISYEIPGAVAIVCIVMMTGSMRLQDIIGAQGGTGASFLDVGGWPWYWFVFRNPITFALFFLYFTTALAEGNRAPFDLPEAESELVAGYSTEYSGMRYLFFFFAEWANVFVMCGIASALFLGGWQIPGVSPAQQEASFGLQLLGVFLFLLKSWLLVFVVIWIRWTLPRVRIDQMMNLCWKWFVPLSFGAFLLTALWMVIGVSKTVQLVISVVTFAVWAYLLVHFIRRVQYNLRQAKVALHLNPFL